MNLLVSGAGQTPGDKKNQPKWFRWQAMSVLFQQHPVPEIRHEVSPYAVVSGLLEAMLKADQDEDREKDHDPGLGFRIWRRKREFLEVSFPPLEENQYDDDETIHQVLNPPVDVDVPPLHGTQQSTSESSFQQCYTLWNEHSEDQEFSLPNSNISPRYEKSSLQKVLDKAAPTQYRRA